MVSGVVEAGVLGPALGKEDVPGAVVICAVFGDRYAYTPHPMPMRARMLMPIMRGRCIL